jgi:FKBP-type peptidyl-prolyl cis-trans isomerase
MRSNHLLRGIRPSSHFGIEPLENRRLLSADLSAWSVITDRSHHAMAIVPDRTAAATRVALSSSTGATELGQFVELTAKVKEASNGSAVSGGTVKFFDGSTLIAKTTVGRNGHATTYSNALFTGSYELTAKYIGDSDFAASKSKSVGLTVSMPQLKKISGKLKYAIVTPGSGGTATTGETLTCDYIGYLTNGTVIGSSTEDGQALQFFLGNAPPGTQQILPGWEEGIPGMKIQETRILQIPGSLAYGNNPPPDSGIPDDATIIYVIELLSIDS